MSRRRNASTARVFAIPLLLGLVSGFGLIAALLSNGAIDWFWDGFVALPLVAILIAIVRHKAQN